MCVTAALASANSWTLTFQSSPNIVFTGSGTLVNGCVSLTNFPTGFYSYTIATSSQQYTNIFGVGQSGGSGGQPVAAIANLADGQIVTNGVFNLTGTADDPIASNAVSYQIILGKADGTPVANITPGPLNPQLRHDGRVPPGSSLGTLDFSMLQNGVYNLQLITYSGGNNAVAEVQIVLNSALKIGQFSFSQQDLVIPVSGIPLSVIRTYNSINPNAGDFGNSWTYAMNDLQVEFDEQREDTEDTDGDVFSMRVGGGRDVTLTLPDGRRVTFTYQLVSSGGTRDAAVWTAPPGVNATLRPTVDNTMELALCYVQPCYPYWNAVGMSWRSGSIITIFPFILTTQDGTQYVIERQQSLGQHFGCHSDQMSDVATYADAYGAAYLAQIIDRNGNTIEITSDGIDYVNPQGQIVKSIPFGPQQQLCSWLHHRHLRSAGHRQQQLRDQRRGSVESATSTMASAT